VNLRQYQQETLSSEELKEISARPRNTSFGPDHRSLKSQCPRITQTLDTGLTLSLDNTIASYDDIDKNSSFLSSQTLSKFAKAQSDPSTHGLSGYQ